MAHQPPGPTANRPDIQYDLLTFGESMVRMTTAPGVRLESAGSLAVTVGGAESNVAVALARLGRRVAWLSALPENPLGQRIAREIAMHGVDVSSVVWMPGARAGVYFMDTGSLPRPTRVLYDRAGSAIATLDVGAVDPEVVHAARMLHLTGITPALSASAAAICRRLATAATDAGIPVALDVNYRARLWTGDAARAGLAPLLERVTLLLCGVDDARAVWGLDGDPEDVARALLDRSAAGVVVVTAGARGAVAVPRGAGSAVVRQPAAPVQPIDPVGAGDAFAAGVLHRWLDAPGDLAGALRSGAALAALKMTIAGDFAIVTPHELAEAIDLVDGSAREIDR